MRNIERIHAEPSRHNIIKFAQALQFGLYFFAFMLAETMVNDQAARFFPPQWVNLIYAGGIACTGLGCLSFALVRKRWKSAAARRAWLTAAGTAAVACAAGVALLQRPGWLLAASFLMLLAFGHMGGAVHYGLCMAFAGQGAVGRATGISAGAGVFLQYLVQSMTRDMTVPFVVSIGLSAGLLVYFANRPLELPAAPNGSHAETNRRHAASLIVATALLTILFSLNDGMVVNLHASGQVALFGPVRLFYCLGLILAGFVADRKQRRLLPISTLLIQIFSILLPALLGNSLYHSHLALLYFCGGFYVIFFTVSFLAFAPDTKDPALWASMGRAVRSLTTAVVVAPIPLLFARFGALGMTVLSCLLVAALLPVVWALPGDRQHRPLPEGQAHKPASREAHETAIAEKYRLTPREREVFSRLVNTEESIQQIAEGLYISRRTCQRHITAIYEKIGVKSRVGLYQLFIEEQEKP